VILLKIERLSENQIRCTLSKADLADKQIKITELAYGSPKAKELFREMMQQASNELGFEVDDIPLMIEAIPVSPDCLILIVTKVEDPEELDTRFSRFSKSAEYDIDDDEDDDEQDDMSGITISHVTGNVPASIPQAVMEALHNIFENIANINENSQNPDSDDNQKTDAKENKPLVFRVLTFDSLSTIIKASKNIASFYFSSNTVYKNPVNGRYYLMVTDDNNTEAEFSRACCILSEYGSLIKTSYAMPFHFMEHYKTVIEDDAVQTLCALK
jgi:adapter protein MecA 1/2